jgi:glycosyltransferase involved in cell wall biosynthesis
MITILHITPHLGGGIGKALSGLISRSIISNQDIKHKILCLEPPIKDQFLNKIRGLNVQIYITSDKHEIKKLVHGCDIVQIEWWNHPAMLDFLNSRLNLIKIRLIIWCHISGLNNPIIPSQLIDVADSFIFTSPCSYKIIEKRNQEEKITKNITVISSGGGFDDLPLKTSAFENELKVGYLGTLNFAKLHPNYLDYLLSVNDENFTVNLIGDVVNKEVLENESHLKMRSNILQFTGYTTNISSELNKINATAYLLNPFHYGTAENALLECMAMGIVPIVLNNPAELCIVDNLNTGIVIGTTNEFASAIRWLKDNPKERKAIGERAANKIREKYSLDIMTNSFIEVYLKVINKDKKAINFNNVFGNDPSDWFLSSQANPEFFSPDGSVKIIDNYFYNYILFEETKGSVFHFNKFFPNNRLLIKWAQNLRRNI